MLKKQPVEATPTPDITLPIASVLSELSISEIYELHPFQESTSGDQVRSLISHFHQTQPLGFNDYGLDCNARSNKKIKQGQHGAKCGQNLLECQSPGSNNDQTERSQCLAFSKEPRKKKRILKVLPMHKQSAGNNRSNLFPPTNSEQQNTSGNQSGFACHVSYSALSPSAINPPRLRKLANLTRLTEAPLDASPFSAPNFTVKNPYYLRPDELKTEFNDINSQFSTGDKSQAAKNTHETISQFHLTLQKPLRADGFGGQGAKVNVVKPIPGGLKLEGRSLDWSKESFFSAKTVDSPFSRDSNRSVQGGELASKHNADYYSSFRRVAQ